MRLSALAGSVPSVLAAILVLPFTTSASTAFGATAADSNRGSLEEIIVTGRRVDESVQEVPISVTAFTQENVEQIAPRTLRDFDGLIPNVRIGMNTAGPSAGAIFIRGIGYADIEKTQAPAVGVIIDGVFQGSSTGQLIDTFDLQQLEINRGPQGVLQGKNTTGGSIVVTRFRPEFNEWGFSGAIQAGSYNEQQLKARINIPLIDDKLALKIAGISKKRDGFYDNVTEGCKECAGDIDYDSATVALRWDPADIFTGTLTYDYIRDRGDIPPQDPTWDGDNPFENAANFDEYQKYDVDALSLNMALDVGASHTLTSITSFTSADDTVGQDFDGGDRTSGASPLGTLHTLREQEHEIFTQELKLSGNFVESLRYTAGVYYYDADLTFAQGTNLIVQLPPAALGIGACSDLGFLGFVDNPNPDIGGALCQLPPSYANQESSESVESWAVFGALTWDITDRIELHAGLRYIDERKDFTTEFGTRAAPTGGPVDPYYGAPINPPTLPGITTFDGFPVEADDKWTDTVGELKASWRFTDSNMLFASYSQGFRSGGFSIRGTDPDRLSFDPEIIDAFEIGSKNDFLDGRLRVNAALFWMDLQDQQFSSIINQLAPPGTNTLILNGEGSKSYGGELEITAALGENFTLIAIGGYQKVKSEDTSFSCLDQPVPPAGFGCNPITNPEMFPGGQPIDIPRPGGDTLFTPKWNYAFTGIYDREIGPGLFTGSLSVVATAKVGIAVDQTGTIFNEPGNELWNARLAYQWSLNNDNRLVVELIGKNLSDVEYREQRLFLGNGLFQGWGAPRTWALALSYMH
jgi:iron complex outermembrane receptor protein